MDNKINSFYSVSKYLDLLGSNIYNAVYEEILSAMKAPNDNGEILSEYISHFVGNGGITGYKFDNNLENTSNIIFLESLMNVFKTNKNDDTIFQEIKASIKNTYKDLIKKQHKIRTRAPTQGERIMKTEEAIEKIDDNANYLGTKNNNVSSDICVRIMPVGIYFNDLPKLIDMAIKIAKLTHNNVISIVSAIISAYFVYFAKNNIAIEKWGYKIIELISSDQVKKYLDLDNNDNMIDYVAILKFWNMYMDFRFDGKKIKKTKSDNNLIFKMKFYRKFVYNWGVNMQGEDCISCNIIAYDTLLNCDASFEKAVYYGMLMPGQVISIGGLLGGLYGLLFGNKMI